MLSKRPSLSQGCIVRRDGHEWCVTTPEGNHRIMSSWAAGSKSWVDLEGRPLDAEWERRGGGVRAIEDMEDCTAHGAEGCGVGPNSWRRRPDLKGGVEEPCLVIEADEEDLGAREDSRIFLG